MRSEIVGSSSAGAAAAGCAGIDASVVAAFGEAGDDEGGDGEAGVGAPVVVRVAGREGVVADWTGSCGEVETEAGAAEAGAWPGAA